MNDVYTEDFSKFGFRELDEAGKLLTAIKNGLPSDFEDEGIKVGFNILKYSIHSTVAQYRSAAPIPAAKSIEPHENKE